MPLMCSGWAGWAGWGVLTLRGFCQWGKLSHDKNDDIGCVDLHHAGVYDSILCSNVRLASKALVSRAQHVVLLPMLQVYP